MLQVTGTSQHQLFRGDCQSGLHVRIAAKKPLLKDTNNKKRLAWAKKHEQWPVDIRPLSKCEIFGSNPRVFVRCRAGKQMISACVVPTVKHGGEGVMVWCFSGDSVCFI